MKLYMHPGACSLAPHIVCRELVLPVDLVRVDPRTKQTAGGGDFTSVNANGYVPVLVLEDGETITEAAVILQFLAELAPERALLPAAGTRARIHAQRWLNFVATELHKPMAMLLQPAYAPAAGPLRELAAKRLDWLNGQIKGPYLMGDRYTVPDAYLFVCLNWSPWVAVDLDGWPALQQFMRRIAERPQVQAALAAEGLAPYGAQGLFFAPRPEPALSAQAAQ